MFWLYIGCSGICSPKWILKVVVKQSVKFTLFSKVISTLIKKYITNTINVTFLKKKKKKKKRAPLRPFGARAPQSCNTTACDITELVLSVGQ